MRNKQAYKTQTYSQILNSFIKKRKKESRDLMSALING